MKNNIRRVLVFVLAACCFFSVTSLSAGAVTGNKNDSVEYATVDAAKNDPIVRYTNPNTGFQVIIQDELNYLKSSEQEDLAKSLEKYTKVTDVLLWTSAHITEQELNKKINDRLGDGSKIRSVLYLAYSQSEDKLWFKAKDTDPYFGLEDRISINYAQLCSYYIKNDGWYTGVKNWFEFIDGMFIYADSEKTTEPYEQFDPVEISDEEALRYTNPETNYQVRIIDEIDLLTKEEEEKLLEEMIPITDYGNIAFWSNSIKEYNTLDQARRKRLELFGYSNASVCMINMANRRIEIQSYGDLYDYFSDSTARSVTDNASGNLKNKEYYEGVSRVFREEYAVLEGHDIPEPMKITGYIIISVILGLTVILTIAFSSRFNPLRSPVGNYDKISAKGIWNKKGIKSHVKSYIRNDSSDGSMGAIIAVEIISTILGGIGDSGGSGSGGSSGGGGGGCGGGGGASF